MPEPGRVQVFTIPSNRSFADALVAGLIARFGSDPLSLAPGRILLPNNRAVRSVTEAFVRASGGGLILPRLIAIGDPDLGERIGAALEPADTEPVPPAIDPTERLLKLASLAASETSADSVRLAAELARTLDSLLVEKVDPAALATAASDNDELAGHWATSLERLQLIYRDWPLVLADSGAIDLAERRNRLLDALARRWASDPPPGFTVAAGITTAAPAVAALLARVARMADGMVVLPGLWLADLFPDAEWDALGPDDQGRSDPTHPQFHLKLLLERIGVARAEVSRWPRSGRAASPAARSRALANAMTAAPFSDKWQRLKPAERRLGAIRAVELPSAAAEAQAIALALREALESEGKTAALVTPDRELARRVSALLKRWGIDADDSAGRPLGGAPPGTLLLAIAEAIAEELAPIPLLALLKHPLVGGEEEARRRWLDDVRLIDLALRGPRPAPGIAGLDQAIAERDRHRLCRGCAEAWTRLRPNLAALAGQSPAARTLADHMRTLGELATALAGDRAWSGPDGRSAAELVALLQASPAAAGLAVGRDELVPVLRQLLDERAVRLPYGGHPRISIWGLLEARLQSADLMVLGGLNEGIWPAAAAPDPWLAPQIRSRLGLPTLEHRIGLAAHDFVSALGAPKVLITRARRDSRAPTVASRLWLRLEAMTGGVARDVRLARLALALDDGGPQQPAGRPAPVPPAEARPKSLWVTAVDRLKADPFAFYAREILRLKRLDPVDAEHSAAWKGSAVHEVLERWFNEDGCDPDRLMARAEAMVASEAIHPMLRALWAPRLIEAIRWIEETERSNRAEGRRPLKAEWEGKAEIAGVILSGRADRIDLLADGSIAILDYKTGKAPSQTAIREGFALQLGLLGLIAEANGFPDVSGRARAFEYWSLVKDKEGFGKCVRADRELGPEAFLERSAALFGQAVSDWLLGSREFTAKLNPVYAPYGDYDQLMRLEEWYARR